MHLLGFRKYTSYFGAYYSDSIMTQKSQYNDIIMAISKTKTKTGGLWCRGAFQPLPTPQKNQSKPKTNSLLN